MISLEWDHGYSVAFLLWVRSCAIPHREPPSKNLAVMTGFVGAFIPFSSTLSLIYAIGGTLLFSGYIVYDTYLINRRLSPDEYILGAISLYLDFINLFLSILRLLSNMQDR
jgi:FtsH-binding integral membrane protein